MQKKLVSVIIPVYNVESYLSKCIQSVLNQTYQNIEIILIDDKCTDASSKICDEFAKNDKVQVIHQQKNLGVSYARNTGINASSGEFILFVDADDYINPNMIECLINKQKESNSDMVYCRYNIVNQNKVFQLKELALEDFCSTNNIDYLFNHAPKNKVKNNIIFVKDYIPSYCWRYLIKKDFLNNTCFNNKLYTLEDFVFLCNLLAKKPNIALVDDYLYNYTIRNNSVSRVFKAEEVTNSLNIIKALESINLEKKYIEGLKFFLYSSLKCSSLINNNKINFSLVNNWSNKYSYKCAKIFMKGKFVKLKNFLVYHKFYLTLKILLKLKEK